MKSKNNAPAPSRRSTRHNGSTKTPSNTVNSNMSGENQQLVQTMETRVVTTEVGGQKDIEVGPSPSASKSPKKNKKSKVQVEPSKAKKLKKYALIVEPVVVHTSSPKAGGESSPDSHGVNDSVEKEIEEGNVDSEVNGIRTIKQPLSDFEDVAPQVTRGVVLAVDLKG
ncbi:hypothetical protein STAS_08255 [Striga asiatica]|uniref:Uncharacterized protein n=1 Tax=Striga asiatica TaxID=4170 RepID=A0A5A7PHR1_STRAF|nr:hypothetical protein STAS_08255 [Striga asiatica]